MGSAIIDAIRSGGGYLQEHGLWVALGVFLFVLLAAFIRKANEAGVAAKPEEERLRIQERQDSIQTTGNIIGCLGAIIITIWIIYGMFFA
jgi:hypothetical protein